MNKASRFVLGSMFLLGSALASCANPGGSTGSVAEPISIHTGSGMLRARGMLSLGGSATFEATTGLLDSSSPPPAGSISQVLLKVYDANTGHVTDVEHFLGSSSAGAFEWIAANVPHGSPFELQALVRGINTDTPAPVIVRDYVRYRPDLIIGADHGIIAPNHGIIAPNQPSTGEAALIATLIAEINGDLGATLDCSLYVDGTLVATNGNVEVAAGSTAPCDFYHTFDSAGTHTITVSLSNIVPGEYGNSINTVTQSVQIIAPNH